MAIDSIPARLFKQVQTRPSSPAYYVRKASGWAPTTWRDFGAEVRTAARALLALGFEPGERACILGFNRPEWVAFDLAAMCAGGAPAGIYTTCSPPEVQYIIDHSESRFVLVEDHGQWEKIAAERERLPKLEKVILMQGAEPIDDDLVLTWSDFCALADGVEDAAVDARIEGLQADEVATLIYTSGTTGPPKAVMLTHHNLSWTSHCAVTDLVPMDADDWNLSYLPLSHIAEQMFSIHVPITVGSAVYYAESIEKVAENLKEVQPTVVFGVPRIWEKFHAGVSAKLKEASGVKAKLLAWARGVGAKVTDLRNRGQEPSGLLAVQYNLATKLIYSKLKPAIGLGNARICVSGAAPIAPEILEFFGTLDIIIYEVYGQSEGTGPTSFNRPGMARFGTVGPALPGVEVKIAEDGEILLRGPNVFKGYFKDPAATGDTLIDGWLHSGDLGAFDREGFLSITGRKKDIIITAGGKNIAPKNIENALKNLELVAEAVVIGDRRKFLSALLTLDEEAAKAFAASRGLPGDGLHEAPAVIDEIQQGVDEVNKLFARVEHVRKFTILPRNFSVEEGELTPTLKIKRQKINDGYADVIDAMYDDADTRAKAG